MADSFRQQHANKPPKSDQTRCNRSCFGTSKTRASSARDTINKLEPSSNKVTKETNGSKQKIIRCKTVQFKQAATPKKGSKSTVHNQRKRKGELIKKMVSPKRKCVSAKDLNTGSTGTTNIPYRLRSGRNVIQRPRSEKVALVSARLKSARPCRKVRSQGEKPDSHEDSFPIIADERNLVPEEPAKSFPANLSIKTLSKDLERKCSLHDQPKMEKSKTIETTAQTDTEMKSAPKQTNPIIPNQPASHFHPATSLSSGRTKTVSVPTSSEHRRSPKPVIQTKERCTRIASNPIHVCDLLYVMRDNKKLLLGSGKYGTVYLCQHAPTGKYVAFKKYDSKTSLEQKRHNPRAYMSDILTEAVCVQIASDACNGYPHLHGIIQNKNGEWLGIILEFIGRSANSKRGMTFRTALTEGILRCEEVWNILEQISSHLLSLHNIGMVHNDFHFGNVLLQKRSKNGVKLFKAYVIDLGLCTKAGQRSIIDPAADLPKIAPELKLSDGVHSAKSDIFAFGYYLIRLADNNEPMDCLKTLGKWCWTEDIGKRPSSMKDVLEELRRLHASSTSVSPHVLPQ